MHTERIRDAVPEDITGLVEIAGRCLGVVDASDGLLSAIENPQHRLRVCVDETDGAVGYHLDLVLETVGSAELLEIAVSPRHQRKGYGRRLLVDFLEGALGKGITELHLEVRAQNLAARRLYEAHGFINVGCRRAYYSDGADAILYSFFESGSSRSDAG